MSKSRSNWSRDTRRVTFKAWQVRFILNRDRSVCYVCGLEGADQADHVIPIAEGGPNHTDNGRAIHAEPCHTIKSREEAERGYARHRAKLTLTAEPHPFDVQET